MKNTFITILAVASLAEGASAALSALTLVSSTATTAQYTALVDSTTVTLNVATGTLPSGITGFTWTAAGQIIQAYNTQGWSGTLSFTVTSDYDLSSNGADALKLFGGVSGNNGNTNRQNRVNSNATITLTADGLSPSGFDSTANQTVTSLTEVGTTVTMVTGTPALLAVTKVPGTILTVADNFSGTPSLNSFTYTYTSAGGIAASDTATYQFGVTAGAVAVIPEPTSAMLLGVATAALLLRRRR